MQRFVIIAVKQNCSILKLISKITSKRGVILSHLLAFISFKNPCKGSRLKCSSTGQYPAGEWVQLQIFVCELVWNSEPIFSYMLYSVCVHAKLP